MFAFSFIHSLNTFNPPPPPQIIIIRIRIIRIAGFDIDVDLDNGYFHEFTPKCGAFFRVRYELYL